METIKLQITPKANKEVELLVYGYVGGWDIQSKDFIHQLKSLEEGTTLRIRINSGGGSAFEGIAIYHAIRRYSGYKIVEIDALAASAASIIAMAGDEIIMPNGTFLMIHNSWTYMEGDANELTRAAEMMEQLDNGLAEIYSIRTGQDTNEIKQMMKDETWLSAETALELGFATSIVDDIPISASLKGSNYFVNGVEFSNIPERIKQKVSKAIKASVKNNKPNLVKDKLMDLQTLMQEHSDLYKQVEAEAFKKGAIEGINAERTRLKEIEDIALPGHEKLVAAAKYENGMSSADLSKAILTAEKDARSKHIQNNQEDANALGEISPNNGSVSNNEVPANIQAAFLSVFNKGRTK